MRTESYHFARSDTHSHSHPREHWTRKNGQWKPKVRFNSIQEALDYIKHHRMEGYTAYICPYCGAIHIGKLK